MRNKIFVILYPETFTIMCIIILKLICNPCNKHVTVLNYEFKTLKKARLVEKQTISSKSLSRNFNI